MNAIRFAIPPGKSLGGLAEGTKTTIAMVVKIMQTKKMSRKIGFGTVNADLKEWKGELELETRLIGGASCNFSWSKTRHEGGKMLIVELSGIDSRS